jgi:hypothetical protein
MMMFCTLYRGVFPHWSRSPVNLDHPSSHIRLLAEKLQLFKDITKLISFYFTHCGN